MVKKLWEYLSTYCYLPRLSSYAVLEETIGQGLLSDEYFGIAAAYSEEKHRYIDLKFNQHTFTINQSDLLVKADIAKAQKHEEECARANAEGSNGTGNSTGIDAGGNTTIDTQGAGQGTDRANRADGSVLTKHFYMSAKLDNTRVNRDINNFVSEIIQHLMVIDGANVELKLEVEVTAENGIPSTTVRTVSENCRTLKVSDFEFDG